MMVKELHKEDSEKDGPFHVSTKSVLICTLYAIDKPIFSSNLSKLKEKCLTQKILQNTTF
jgi:hypothetical protein